MEDKKLLMALAQKAGARIVGPDGFIVARVEWPEKEDWPSDQSSDKKEKEEEPE